MYLITLLSIFTFSPLMYINQCVDVRIINSLYTAQFHCWKLRDDGQRGAETCRRSIVDN